MASRWQLICTGLVALVAALYMIELPPSFEDDIVEIGNTRVMMIAECARVFAYVGDLSNYGMWFPGIENMTALYPGPMQNGKVFEELVDYPIVGGLTRTVLVIKYDPPRTLQFVYEDLSKIVITIQASQDSTERCNMVYRAGTKRTSLLYHMFVGLPLRIMYSLRGRHAMFAIRSMFNNQ